MLIKSAEIWGSKLGERVCLATKYLGLKLMKEVSKFTSKLMPRYIGPFVVMAKVGKVSYCLALVADMKVHPVVHLSLLKPYLGDGNYQPPPLSHGWQHYTVSGVRGHHYY